MFAKFDAPVIYAANNSNRIEDANANFNTLVNTIIANNSNGVNNGGAGFCTMNTSGAMSHNFAAKKYDHLHHPHHHHHLIEGSHPFGNAGMSCKQNENMNDEQSGADQTEVNSLNLDFDDVDSKSDIDGYYANNCNQMNNNNSNNNGTRNTIASLMTTNENNTQASKNMGLNGPCGSNVGDGSCLNSGSEMLATNTSGNNITNTNTNASNSNASNIIFHANEQNENTNNSYYTHIRSQLGPSSTSMLLNVGNRLVMGNANTTSTTTAASMNLQETVAATTASSSSSPSSSSVLSSPSSSSASSSNGNGHIPVSKADSCAILKSIANSANMNGNISNSIRKHDQQHLHQAANAIFGNQTNDLALFIRNTHCVKEKIRRDRIKASCIHLRRLLPNVNGIKTDMATLLETTVVWAQLINAYVPEEYVKSIKSKLSEYATLKNSVCGSNGEQTLTKAALNSFRADKISIPRLKPKMSSSKSPSSNVKQQQNLQSSSKSALMQSQVAPCHQNNLNTSMSSISSSSFDSASPNASISPISLPSISSFQTNAALHHHHAQPNSSSTPNNLVMCNQPQSLAHPSAHNTAALNGISMPIANAAAAAAAAACINMKSPGQNWLSFSQQSKLAPSFHAMPLHLATTGAAHGAGMSDKSTLTLNEAFLLNHHQQNLQHQQQQLQQHHQQLYSSMQMAVASSNDASVNSMVADCPNSNFNQILNNHHQSMTNAKRIISYLNNQSSQSQSFGK